MISKIQSFDINSVHFDYSFNFQTESYFVHPDRASTKLTRGVIHISHQSDDNQTQIPGIHRRIDQKINTLIVTKARWPVCPRYDDTEQSTQDLTWHTCTGIVTEEILSFQNAVLFLSFLSPFYLKKNCRKVL